MEQISSFTTTVQILYRSFKNIALQNVIAIFTVPGLFDMFEDVTLNTKFTMVLL